LEEVRVGRLVIASNRVGSSLNANDGGLATALLAAVDRQDVVWFGWSGEIVDELPGPTRLQREGNLVQALVDLERSDYHGYYLEFANRVLWPVCHYRVNLAEYGRDQWATYVRVNDMFAERLAPLLKPDDIVWIHDYHMIPLGASLRRLGVDNPLAFFLHIPFPATEVWTTLPVHEDLVRSLFAYNLVGFQTESDLQAFQDYVEREADGQAEGDGILCAYGTSVRAASFPISIDPRVVAARAVRAASTRQAIRLRDSLSGRQLIIGVDRLDYTKGLVHRLDAVERLLETRPQYRREIVMLQIAPPSREDVPEYRQIRAELDARIGRINGRFAEPDQLPLRYINRRFRQETLFGFYRASRVALVTPLRDGMNLVAKEFVASQDPEDPGVLILSRFAGAARELDTALIINPFDVDQIVDALDRALEMPVEERRARYEAMMSWLQERDVHAWRDFFLDALRHPEDKFPRRPVIADRIIRQTVFTAA
jgi:trehalose 6-phosphate synthase